MLTPTLGVADKQFCCFIRIYFIVMAEATPGPVVNAYLRSRQSSFKADFGFFRPSLRRGYAAFTFDLNGNTFFIHNAIKDVF